MTPKGAKSSVSLTWAFRDDMVGGFLIILTAKPAFVIVTMVLCPMFDYFVMPSKECMAS